MSKWYEVEVMIKRVYAVEMDDDATADDAIQVVREAVESGDSDVTVWCSGVAYDDEHDEEGISLRHCVDVFIPL